VRPWYADTREAQMHDGREGVGRRACVWVGGWVGGCARARVRACMSVSISVLCACVFLFRNRQEVGWMDQRNSAGGPMRVFPQR